MLNICSLYSQQFGINFYPSKSKYYCTNKFFYLRVNFDLGELLLENINDCFVYLKVKFRIVIGMLKVDIDPRLRKFDAEYYYEF